MTFRSIWIGFDTREAAPFFVAKYSIQRRMSQPVPVHGVVLDQLQRRGLYTRPIEMRDGRLFDPISEHPMATEFAISRFLVPHLHSLMFSGGSGWCLFMDPDMLVRANLTRLFEQTDDRYAVMCVKHDHRPTADTKMGNQVQSRYPRKNWSSFMLFNCGHPANDALDLRMVNTLPGRDLHRFCWLQDDDIGALAPEWNWLVGASDPAIEPKVVHFTEGGPWLPGYERVPYAEEWRHELGECAGENEAGCMGVA